VPLTGLAAGSHELPAAKHARRAVATVLFCHGAATASWVTRLPPIKASLDLGAGGLGLALVGTPVGLAVAVVVTPAAVRRFSSAATARWGLVCASLTITFPALAWSGVTLAVGLIGLGLAFGVTEIAANVQAVAVERLYGRPVMTGMHAMWSVGLIVGSVAASLAAAASVVPFAQLLVVGLLLAGVAAVVGRWLLEPTLERAAPEPSPGSIARGRLPKEGLLVIAGLIAFCAYLAEGSVSDWSSVYLHSAQHASLAVAALAVSGFSAGQVIGRLLGDRIITRVGRIATIRYSALIAAAGMALAIAAPSPAVALIGYGVLGLGSATIVPTAFSIAGMAAGATPARELSRVTAMGYAGLFLGPVAIGLAAQASGLAAALAIPASLLVLIVPLSRTLSRDFGVGA
jgi:predicted MFS family arabinose efflux permease